MKPPEKTFMILSEGTKFTALHPNENEEKIAHKDVRIELIQKKMGVTYFFLGKTPCKAILGLILTLFMGCSDPAFSQKMPLTVQIAQSQLGKGEIGGNNRGPAVEIYTRGQDVAWCSAFVSWVRYQAGYRDHYFLLAKSYWNSYQNRRVRVPKSGDLIVFNRGVGQGHIGIVEKIRNRDIWTIEGNRGKFPSKVKRVHYELGHIENLIGFIRV